MSSRPSPRSGFWDTRHGAVHVRVSGRGPALMLLHSAGLASTQWLKVAAALTQEHTVVAPDLLGFGRSPHPESAKSLPLVADADVVHDLQQAIAEPIALVGHSYGGAVALAYARRRDANLSSVYCFEPVCFGVLHSAGDAESLGQLARASVVPSHDTEGWMERFIDYWSGEGHWRSMTEMQREHALRYAPRTQEVVQALLDDRVPHSSYASIDVPVALVAARHSPSAARRVCEILHAAVPTSSYSVLDAGHMAPLDQPELVSSHLRHHLLTP